MTSLLFLDNFYPVMSIPTSLREKESDELLYIRFGHSLWSANRLPAQVIKPFPLEKIHFFMYLLYYLYRIFRILFKSI